MPLIKFAAILAILLTAVLGRRPALSGPVQKAHASHAGLQLVLTVRVSGATVHAQAKLTNRGPQPFEYYGGCAPPVLQIQARDTSGHRIYGWVPARVTCLALSVRHLAPGASLRERAHFTIQGPVKVRSIVQVKVTPSYLFRTRPLDVTPR